MLKRAKKSPSYSENTIRKEGEKTGDPAAAVDLRSSENIKLGRIRLRDDALTAAGAHHGATPRERGRRDPAPGHNQLAQPPTQGKPPDFVLEIASRSTG